jgi:inorganic triphosphatase YgiF
MDQAHEIELKLEIPAERLRALEKYAQDLRSYAQPKTFENLVSVYFDTDSFELRENGLSLRIRSIGNEHVQTIKRSEGVFDRDEWENQIGTDVPDLDAARRTALQPFLSKKLRHSLRPVFETRVHRTVYPIRFDSSEIEVSFDEGKISAGTRTAQLSEVELELRSGDPSHLFHLAHQLAEQAPLRVGLKSKAERGYELITDQQSTPIKSAPVHVSPQLDAATALQTIARTCIYQLIANLAAVTNHDAEGIHQARVALRRLRAAMSLFSPLLRDEQTEALKKELRWLTGELAPARELDVFMHRAVTDMSEAGKTDSELVREIEAKRNSALDRAHTALDSERFRSLLLDAIAWIEIGNWRNAPADPKSSSFAAPIGKSAARQLSRRHKKILRRGRHLTRLDTDQRHKLRIAAKKLRYASDFFADVFPRRKALKRRKRFVQRLRRVQDSLGDLNDIVVHQRLSAEAAKSSRKDGAKSNKAFSAGRIAGHEDMRFRKVLRASKKAFRAFAPAKTYWA